VTEEGELEHGDNLWPEKGVWEGAESFVSLPEPGTVIQSAHRQRTACLDY
jgi:hypothetical protein